MRAAIKAAKRHMVETAKYDLATEVLALFGKAHLPVNGGSMLPSLWPGDLLEVQHRDPAAFAPGDIAVYHRHSRLVAHRIIEKIDIRGRIFLITQGDCLRHPDSPVAAEEVLGRAVVIHRGQQRISPRLTATARAVSRLLARSEFATRVALGINRRLRT
jgi:signal peptidase I